MRLWGFVCKSGAISRTRRPRSPLYRRLLRRPFYPPLTVSRFHPLAVTRWPQRKRRGRRAACLGPQRRRRPAVRRCSSALGALADRARRSHTSGVSTLPACPRGERVAARVEVGAATLLVQLRGERIAAHADVVHGRLLLPRPRRRRLPPPLARHRRWRRQAAGRCGRGRRRPSRRCFAGRPGAPAADRARRSRTSGVRLSRGHNRHIWCRDAPA